MKSILILDDEERIRRTYRNLLEGKGYQVLDVSNAVEAKEIIVKQAVDLILLDINMGKINGDIFFEVAHTFHPNIKVIVSSVYPLEEQHDLIQSADGYYDKSEGLNVLLRKIKDVFEADKIEPQKKKILIIDDDQKIRLIYHELLYNAGYSPVEVPDGENVLEFLNKQIKEIDLIILDLAMPEITGIDFFEVIKEKYPDTKVIISSNYEVAEQEALVFTANDYHDKSDNNNVLLKKIANLFKEESLN